MAHPEPFLTASLEEAIWSLAYACTGSGREAARARTVFERAASEGDFALLFRRWWQEKTLITLPPDTVVQPWAAEVHQRIADQLDGWRLLGDEPLLLPCTGCGRVFASKPPRFARTCGRCQPYTPSGRPNPAGSRVMYSQGHYPAGPFGPRHGQSVLCAHPNCIQLFLATDSQRRYCDLHQADRKATARVRKRTQSPKHSRVRFYPTIESETLQVNLGNNRSERVRIGLQGYEARDKQELVVLAELVATGKLEARWRGPAHLSEDGDRDVLGEGALPEEDLQR